MFRAASIILAKDLRLRFRDRSVLLFALVIPLALMSVFSLLLPDQNDFEMLVGLVDLDGGDVAAGFSQGVVPGLEASGSFTVTRYETRSAAVAGVESGAIAAAWVIPAGFSDDVRAGRAAVFQVVANPDRTLSAQVATSIAQRFTSELDRISLTVGTVAASSRAPASPEQLQSIAQGAVADGPLVRLDAAITASQQLDPTSYLAAGMSIFFLFFTVTFGVTGFLEERQQGTLPRLLAAPIGPGAIHLGKALGAAIIGTISMVVLAVSSTLLLNATWGDPFGVAVLIMAAVFAALGVMALVGSFAKTAEQASNLQSIVALALGLSGGVFFPLGDGLLATLALFSPHGWFLRGLGDLAGAGPWTAVLPAVAALALFGIVAGTLGVLRLMKETA